MSPVLPLLTSYRSRLQLSPSPSQSAAVSRTHEERHKLRGRKRKQEGPTGSSPASKMGSLEREGESAPVRLSEVDEGGRFIRLQNHSHTEQQLGGWVVRRIYPDMGNISFEIPSPCVLDGGQTLTIWASGFEEEAHSDDLILEDHTSWGPATDAKILIFNPQQKVPVRHGPGRGDVTLSQFTPNIQTMVRTPV
uniref:LTD domain-containing protein n=1 Tax=Knipowitschia caucasica TaxID=637954 RepID=A0AAV2LT72_KNICA